VVEDILGHLLFVTWDLEEARQIAAAQIINAKVERNLISVRKIPCSLSYPPRTEFSQILNPIVEERKNVPLTECPVGSRMTLGYCVEIKTDLLNVDLRSVRRVQIGNHLATVGCPRRKWNKTAQRSDISSLTMVSLWHPIDELTTIEKGLASCKILEIQKWRNLRNLSAT
jgi:hypothetical protein